MVKLESEWKKHMVLSVKDHGGYGTRIEDQFRVGFPDTVLATPKTGLFLFEVKRFDGLFFAASPRQWIEIKQINAGGGKAGLVGIHIKHNSFFIAKPGDEERAYAARCTAQREGETFAQLF